MPETSKNEVGHETRDVNARAIGCFALALVVAGIAAMLIVAGMFRRFDEVFPGGDANRITTDRIDAPSPELQVNPASDFAQLRARENETLTTYGWVDRDSGIVRIPIERAMEIIAERGLPAAPDSAGKTPTGMRQEKAKEGAR